MYEIHEVYESGVWLNSLVMEMIREAHHRMIKEIERDMHERII